MNSAPPLVALIQRLLVIAGPSGSGKTTLVEELLKKHPWLARCITVTTREAGDGEVDGIDYIFTDRATFEKWIADGLLVEWAEYGGNYYGTLRSTLEAIWQQGRTPVLNVDVQGYATFKRIYERDARVEVIGVFIDVVDSDQEPYIDVLRGRLDGRKRKLSPASIEKRLAAVPGERAQRFTFDYIVVNKVLETAIEKLSVFVLARAPEG